MRAAQVHCGDPVVVEEVDQPTPGPGQVRVRIQAASVNPADVMVSSGSFWSPDWGVVGVGWDFAGAVDAVGDGVDDLRPGDLVAGIDDDPSRPIRGQAEYTVAARDHLAPLPEGLTPAAAATLPLNSLTAMQALDLLSEPRGRTLLVTGAAGGVGAHAVTLATRRGWRVVGLARPDDDEFVRRCGAVQVVTDLTTADYPAVLDAAALQQEALRALADGGEFVGVLPFATPSPERHITPRAVQMHADRAQLVEALELAAKRVLDTRIAGQVGFEELEDAYRAVAAGGSRGRWILTP